MSSQSTRPVIIRPRLRRVFSDPDPYPTTVVARASTSRDRIFEEEDENTRSEEVGAEDNADELQAGRHYDDYNTTNMDLDGGDYTSEDEEEDDDDTVVTLISRSFDTFSRTNSRSFSQRSRAFSPLGSRFASFRRQNSTSLPASLSIKYNTLPDPRSLFNNGSDEPEQFSLPPSSFLNSGMTFIGTQNLMNTQFSQREKWEVKVTIYYVDYKTGTVIGLMEALNVPSSSHKVVTYWEGEMIDLVNHMLWTNKWKATPDVDLQHWRKFEAFRGVDIRSISRGGLSRSWFKQVCEKYIFMRWKERCFVNVTAQDSGLTIAGFYYICIRRIDGAIEGYYFDPVSTPYQKLTLKPLRQGNGFSFAEFSFN